MRGGIVTLTCRATGYPRPVITWRFNMDYIPINFPKANICSEHDLISGEAASILKVTDIDETLVGRWTCEASNSLAIRLASHDSMVSIRDQHN